MVKVGGDGTDPIDLSQGVDLNNPILSLLRNFTANAALKPLRSVICVGLTPEGNLVAAALCPAGPIEALGMLWQAGLTLTNQQSEENGKEEEPAVPKRPSPFDSNTVEVGPPAAPNPN